MGDLTLIEVFASLEKLSLRISKKVRDQPGVLTLENLTMRLARARSENRLERQLQQLTYPKVLVLDEMGYLPMSREDASLFFRLLSRRYEKASIIITSNKSFTDWGEIFGDQVMATAILDRLLHHSTVISIKGDYSGPPK